MSQQINDQLILVVGESASGKSASLANLPNHERVMYLNCESGKRLPFRNKFQTYVITDPYEVFDGFDHALNNPDIDVIVVDTLTFLMDMFETKYVFEAADKMKGWSLYQQFFKTLMQDKVANSDKSVIIMAHTRADLDETAMEMRTQVPIKGGLKNNGIEAYFSTVVATKRITLKDLKDSDPSLLNISEDDKLLEFKHVFQTRITKTTKGERIRSPMGMFEKNQVYMDNDAGKLLDHLNEYYA
jgi:hypothetical protein